MHTAITATCRTAGKQDAAAIWTLVRDSAVLDLNSAYLYLLLCTDFADTTVVVECSGQLQGFVSGYRPPGRPDTLFLWQIGVARAARGRGLGKTLVRAFLSAPGSRGAQRLETTIAPGNVASLALFQGIARDLGARMERSGGFLETDFPTTPEGHDPEPRYCIHPLPDHSIHQDTLNLTR